MKVDSIDRALDGAIGRTPLKNIRIDFRKASRPDSHEEQLQKKFIVVNGYTSVNKPTKNGDFGLVAMKNLSKETVDKNGFRNPGKFLFPQDWILKAENVSWTKSSPIGPGLNNLGNTCFLNAVLQCLTYTPPLNNYLMSKDHSSKCSASCVCIMCELEKHVQFCMSHLKGSFSPKRIVGNIKSMRNYK
jgi:ubiquitin carboxyl-terminal hydrolase 36/42